MVALEAGRLEALTSIFLRGSDPDDGETGPRETERLEVSPNLKTRMPNTRCECSQLWQDAGEW